MAGAEHGLPARCPAEIGIDCRSLAVSSIAFGRPRAAHSRPSFFESFLPAKLGQFFFDSSEPFVCLIDLALRTQKQRDAFRYLIGKQAISEPANPVYLLGQPLALVQERTYLRTLA